MTISNNEQSGNFVNKIEELENMHKIITEDKYIFKKRNLSEKF